MARRVLVKIVCQVVTGELEGDRITAEQEGPRLACYSPQELAALWEQAEAEVAAANPNRQQRRRKA